MEEDTRWLSVLGVETDRLGEALPAIVEGPEAVGTEPEGAGNVQGVEGANSEKGTKVPGKVDAGLPGALGEAQ